MSGEKSNSSTRMRPNKELPETVLFTIFNILTIDEMFLISKVCKHWNQSFKSYLEKQFFERKAFGICLTMDQLPEIYQECLNASPSDVKRRWTCADVDHISGDGKCVPHLYNVSKNMFFVNFEAITFKFRHKYFH